MGNSPPSKAKTVPAKEKSRRSKGAKGERLSHAQWFKQLDIVNVGVSSRLIEFLDSLEGVGATWHLKKCLLVRFRIDGRCIDVLGIEPNCDVQIPWLIADKKALYKGFAMTLAHEISGAILYETRTMWCVKGRTGRITVDELLDASHIVLEALAKLRINLEN